MIGAGAYRDRVRIERRAEAADDGYGNVLDPWATVATRWARWRPEFGREAVAAGRLESTRLGVVTLRRDAVTAGLTAADRLVFVAGSEPAGTPAQIVSIVTTLTEVELSVIIGVAT